MPPVVKPNQCFICKTITVSIDEHHVYKRSIKGVESEVIYPCTRCHDLIHKAEAAFKHSSDKARDILSIQFPEGSTPFKLLTKYAYCAFTSATSGKNVNPTQQIRVDISKRAYNGIKDQAKANKKSIDSYITALLENIGRRGV